MLKMYNNLEECSLQRKNVLVQCRQGYVTYSSGFVISTSTTAWRELRALIHYDFIFQPTPCRDLVSPINIPNKDRKHTQCIYKTTNGAVSNLLQGGEKCMFINACFMNCFELSLCQTVNVCVCVCV